MSLFTLIKYPVNKGTTDFRHIPYAIWYRYMEARVLLSTEEREVEDQTNAILIRMLMDWDEPET